MDKEKRLVFWGHLFDAVIDGGEALARDIDPEPDIVKVVASIRAAAETIHTNFARYTTAEIAALVNERRRRRVGMLRVDDGGPVPFGPDGAPYPVGVIDFGRAEGRNFREEAKRDGQI